MRERDDILASLAYWVAHYRRLHKLSQLELAVRAGVDTRQIGRIEQQANVPSVVLLYHIAEALDISVNELLVPMPSAEREKKES